MTCWSPFNHLFRGLLIHAEEPLIIRHWLFIQLSAIQIPPVHLVFKNDVSNFALVSHFTIHVRVWSKHAHSSLFSRQLFQLKESWSFSQGALPILVLWNLDGKNSKIFPNWTNRYSIKAGFIWRCLNGWPLSIPLFSPFPLWMAIYSSSTGEEFLQCYQNSQIFWSI